MESGSFNNHFLRSQLWSALDSYRPDNFIYTSPEGHHSPFNLCMPNNIMLSDTARSGLAGERYQNMAFFSYPSRSIGDHVQSELNRRGLMAHTTTHEPLITYSSGAFQARDKKQKQVVEPQKPIVLKGKWTLEGDRLLASLVENYQGSKIRWSEIAKMFDGKEGKQCRDRWYNHVRPGIKKDKWSEVEVEILIAAHRNLGSKWLEIAEWLPGRTENSIKNHWNATKRRRKWSPDGPTRRLKDYINSLENQNQQPEESSSQQVQNPTVAPAEAEIPAANIPMDFRVMQDLLLNDVADKMLSAQPPPSPVMEPQGYAGMEAMPLRRSYEMDLEALLDQNFSFQDASLSGIFP